MNAPSCMIQEPAPTWEPFYASMKNSIMQYVFTSFLVLLTISCKQNIVNINDQKSIEYQNTEAENAIIPDTILIEGEITKIISQGYCGTFCSGGLIEVMVQSQQLTLPDSSIFLVTACMSDKVKIGNNIKVKASKLKVEDSECYYKEYAVKYSSHPNYYKLSEKESSKLSY